MPHGAARAGVQQIDHSRGGPAGIAGFQGAATAQRVSKALLFQERDHAVVLRALAGGALPTPRSTLDTILRRERWHVRGTGWIGYKAHFTETCTTRAEDDPGLVVPPIPRMRGRLGYGPCGP